MLIVLHVLVHYSLIEILYLPHSLWLSDFLALLGSWVKFKVPDLCFHLLKPVLLHFLVGSKHLDFRRTGGRLFVEWPDRVFKVLGLLFFFIIKNMADLNVIIISFFACWAPVVRRFPTVVSSRISVHVSFLQMLPLYRALML